MTNNVLDTAKAKCLEEIGGGDDYRELIDRLTDACFDEVSNLYALQDLLHEIDRIIQS